MKYTNLTERWKSLEDYFGRKLNYIVCFDISHIDGKYTIGSCVACGPKGALYKEYRFFNITDITPGDDYQAIHQSINKRFNKIEKLENVPDIIFIDGGIGQLKYAISAISEKLHQWSKRVEIIGISKGAERILGNEKFIDGYTQQILDINKNSKFFYLITQLRDEAHRYANKKRQDKEKKEVLKSGLEDLIGVGPNIAKALTNYFAGNKNIREATLEELESIPGIGKKTALTIYKQLK